MVNLKKQSISNYENLYFCCLSTHRPDVTFGSIRVLILINEKITLIDTVFNHNHYNFLKCDWCISCFIFHLSLCTVVIGQCNRIVGCNRTPVIGQLKQLILLILIDHNNHSNNHLSKEKRGNFQNGGIFN